MRYAPLIVENQQELKFEQFFAFFCTRFPNAERIRYIFSQSYFDQFSVDSKPFSS